jgi:hypothetical protein
MVNDEFAFYKANQDKIVQEHLDKFVVIKNQQIRGYYSSEEEAFDSMLDNELGTFMVKRCQKPGTDVLEYFNNTVAFA